MAMIFVTGDTHGRKDLGKLDPSAWRWSALLGRDDQLVVLGDFGGVFEGDGCFGLGRNDLEVLAWWEDQPWTTLFVDGNHENHDVIDTLPVAERWGGKVQVVPGFPHVVHLIRGEVYDLPLGDGTTARCFVMGGAKSTDRWWRTEGVNWWAREMPSDEEYENAVSNLERVGWSVDYVFTHEVPYGAMADALDWRCWVERSNPPRNELSGFLQYVDDRLDKQRLRMWYAGHHHIDRMVMDDWHCVLYQQVISLGDAPS